MAVRVNHCPECKITLLTVLKEHNPATTDMNMRVTLKCEECSHEFEDRTTSRHHQKMREMGFCI